MAEERMAEILKELLDDRKKRENEIAEERKRQEETLENLLTSLRWEGCEGVNFCYVQKIHQNSKTKQVI